MKAKFLALAALVLGLASCQTDPEVVNPTVDAEVDFQLSVAAPELATRAGNEGAADQQNAMNSAYGAIDYLQGAPAGDYRQDWGDVNLRYTLEVYDKADNYAGAKPVKDRQVIIVDEYQPVVFDLRLVPNREYHFVVFADFVAQNVTNETQTSAIEAQRNIGIRHYIGATLADITVKNDAINDEVADSYFATKDINIANSAAQDIVLRRPYGKVRVVATDLAELNLNVDPKAVKVTYTAKHPQTFNAVTGAIGATEDTNYEFTYEYAEISKESLASHCYTAGYDDIQKYGTTNANGEVRHTHMTLFTDYILALPKGQTPIHFTMQVYDDAEMTSLIKETAFTTDIPVERNKLTTVIGNVLTTATEIEVRIDDNFDGENKVEIDEVATQESFLQALEDAANKKYAAIELTGDVEWQTGAGHGSTPLIGDDAVTESLTIYGNGRTFKATGAGVGPIRMANGGKLIFQDVVFVDESVSYNEGAWELGYLEFAGELEFINCEFKNAVMMSGEEAIFNECSFNSNKDNEYAVWVDNGNAYFTKCAFEGPRAIKVHEAYGSEVGEVVVDESTFTNISKKPGIAMGDLNAATKVEIKNSTFTNCQAGDQGLYIYETDTDVATFDFAENDNVVINTVTVGANLDEMLQQNIKSLTIELGADVELNTSNAYLALGGEDTELIVIDGMKLSTAAATGAETGNHKLTLATTYWSRFTTKNPNAKVILRNLTLTSSQDTGTWNSYDVTLNCNVELENVDLLKAVAFDGAGKSVKVKDVTIKESHDYYAMWIAAAGQTVNIENLVIESAGRGIKIDEQYVNDAVAKVTLNVKDAKFTTAKKAAIVVKSVAGADITLENVDIAGVAADAENVVWIDEDAKNYAGMVSVDGGSAIVEGATVVDGNDTFAAAVATENATVQLPAGRYTMPKNIAKNVTIICAEGTVFTGKSSLDINGATVIGATFQSGSDDLVAYYSTINGTYKNCVFNGDLKWSKAGDTVVFENCVFNGPDYALHFDTAVANSHVILKGCEVNSEWRVAIGAAVSMFEAIDTKFNVAGFINLWGKAKFTNCAFNKPSHWICCMDTTEFTNCTCEGRALVANDIRIEDTVITINGVTYEVVADGVMKVNSVYEISNAAGLTWFSDQLNNKKNTFAGKTVKVVNDIDMTGATYYGGSIASYPSYCFKGTFDGGKKEISNLTISVENDIHGAAALIPTLAGNSAKIKDVILKNVNISSSHYAAGIWGYTTSDDCWISVTNCHVEGGTITGNIYNGDNADKVGGIGGIFYSGTVSGCSVKDVTISGYRDTAGIVGWAADTRATIKNNTIENVTINVNNTTNYKNYTKRAQYDVNNYVGEGVGKAKLEDNTGEATINWGSIAE